MSDLDLFAAAGNGLDISHFGLTDDGLPFVQAPAFARALTYSRTSDALKMLDDDERGTAICRTPGGDQRMSVIYEDGIWELIFRSTLPSAKAIKARVKAILRQLRETGVVDTRELDRPMTELEMARKYVAALERVAELEPAAASWTQLADSAGDYSVREAAQILDRDPSISTGQRRLFEALRRIGWISGRWTSAGSPSRRGPIRTPRGFGFRRGRPGSR
jgi:anti-repressor protein